ncbi:MAG: hypothetical protein ACM3MI_11650 [Clostridiales bacterium]
MELIPIVETTLSIFTGLLILGVLISYIASKIRKNENTSSTQSDRYKQESLARNIISNKHDFALQYQHMQYKPAIAASAQVGYVPSGNQFKGEEFRSNYFAPRPSENNLESKPRQAKSASSKFTVLNDLPLRGTTRITESIEMDNNRDASFNAKNNSIMFK